ncbi:MAG: hypothetical protein IKL53_02205 [Lachnospiraceae bacterium]|nr:hypothetical protein [Lachnospiraceae bacterium]
MDIMQFIETQYPIKDRVRAKLENPYERIAQMDDLPYDKIGPDEFGTITKLVEVEEGRYISVLELISLTKDEIEKVEDLPLQIVWENYMSQVDLQDLNIIDIMDSVRQHQKLSSMREEQVGVLSL